MKNRTILRFSSKEFQSLSEHLTASGDDESFAYALCSKAKSSECDIYVCNRLILPDANDFKRQSHVSVEPTQEFQAIVYGLAHDLGLVVLDIHTHPFSSNVHFSSIDDHHGIQNAKYIAENLPVALPWECWSWGRASIISKHAYGTTKETVLNLQIVWKYSGHQQAYL